MWRKPTGPTDALNHVDMNTGWEGIIRNALVAHLECSVFGLAVTETREYDMET